MADATPAVGRLPRFLTASLARELGILLTLSVMFPFLIHILPVSEDARLGPRLLPLFYAPLLATLLGRTSTAWLVALLSPSLNWLLTSHPGRLGAVVMTIQLAVFVLTVRVMVRKAAARWFVAIAGYLAGLGASAIVAGFLSDLIGGRQAYRWALETATVALPGIAILVAITVLVLQTYPPGPGSDGPATA